MFSISKSYLSPLILVLFLLFFLLFILLFFLFLLFLLFLLLIFLLLFLRPFSSVSWSSFSSSSPFSSISSSSSLSSSWRWKSKPVHVKKVLGQVKNYTIYLCCSSIFLQKHPQMNHPFLFHTSYGDLGPNKAYKTLIEICYTLCDICNI